MRIEKVGERYVVARGDVHRPQYFSFYVDSNGSSWTKFSEQAHKHTTKESAATTIDNLRKRVLSKRKGGY